MAYTQDQLDTTVQMLFDFLAALKKKEPSAFNAISALRTAGEELGSYGEVGGFNDYLS